MSISRKKPDQSLFMNVAMVLQHEMWALIFAGSQYQHLHGKRWLCSTCQGWETKYVEMYLPRLIIDFDRSFANDDAPLPGRIQRKARSPTAIQ